MLRLAPGASIEVFDGRGGRYGAEIGPGFEWVALGPREVAPPASVEIALVVALAKGEKMDLVVQKATELGVGRVLPFEAERSVVRLEPAKGEERAGRWRRIAEEAARQCGRADVPEVSPPAALARALAALAPGTRTFVFHPGGGRLDAGGAVLGRGGGRAGGRAHRRRGRGLRGGRRGPGRARAPGAARRDRRDRRGGAPPGEVRGSRVTDVRCPRCHRDAPEGTAFCAGCGAPLLLRDEAPGPSLDAPLDLDRRSLRPPPARVATPMETVPGVLPAPLPGPAATPPPRPPPVPGAAPAPAGSHANELASIERSHWDLRTITAAARGQPIAAPAIPALAAAPPPPPPPAAARAAAGGASAPVPAPAAAPAEVDDLPDADVEELEVHVARAEPWRRGVAWLVDGVPFVAAGGGSASSSSARRRRHGARRRAGSRSSSTSSRASA